MALRRNAIHSSCRIDVTARELAEKHPASQVHLAKINKSPFRYRQNGSTIRSRSCLADSHNRTPAAMIASGSRERVRQPRRCSLRDDKLPSLRRRTPCRPINQCANRACWESHRRRPSGSRASKHRLLPNRRARDPAIEICAHPQSDKIRHDRSPGRQGLWSCRRRHRAHSPASLTARQSLGSGLRLRTSKRKAPRGGHGAFGYQPDREQRGGGPHSAGAGSCSPKSLKRRTRCRVPWPAV